MRETFANLNEMIQFHLRRIDHEEVQTKLRAREISVIRTVHVHGTSDLINELAVLIR
jgi:hypothetical protein